MRLNRKLGATILGFGLCFTLTGCSLSSLVDVKDPSDIVSPDVVNTEVAALGMYKNVIFQVARDIGSNALFGTSGYMLASAMASDEMMAPTSQTTTWQINSRNASGALTDPYAALHKIRLNADQAIGSLKKYAPNLPRSYIGELYALKGYLYIYFGEMYCSGVPFSYAPFEGDIVIEGGISTTDMFNRAAAQFDTALTYATDSARIKQFALVGKARALVNLKQYAVAAQLVTSADVPTDFAYNMRYTSATSGLPNYANVWANVFFSVDYVLANRLGGNGLDYISASSGQGGGAPDPRVPSRTLETMFQNYIVPSRFNVDSPIPIADGVEARLIEAEALLADGQTGLWANALNELRQLKSIPALSADSTTLATPALRVSVMFRERAFWLYGTGHRLGDMRRLVRQYAREANDVFPTGFQAGWVSPKNVFGDAVNFPVPTAESQNNPKYSGCFNRDA